MRFVVLGSGSGGNAAVVEAGRMRLLVDAGLSARQILRRLAQVGVDPATLDGILLTHEHGDHVRGLRVLLRSLSVPIYATAMTREILADQLGPIAWRLFEPEARFNLGGVEIEPFRVPHDAVDPVGFIFRQSGCALGLVSDCGHVSARMLEHLRGVDTLFVEANYDDALLAADTRRPWSTKQRITSRHGHLSNRQVAELLIELGQHGLSRAVLGHLSRDCNSPAAALQALGTLLPSVCCAGQDEPCGWHQAAPPTCDIAFGRDELFGS